MQRFVEEVPATNLSDVLAGMWRRKLLLIALPLLGLLGGELFLMASKATYLSEAQVLIENLATPFDRSNSVPEQNVDVINDKMVQSQVAVMKSRDIAARVVDDLGLDNKSEYNAKLKPGSFLGNLAIALGFKDDPQLFTPKDLATKALVASITIYPIPETNAIGIKSVSTNAQLAATTANAIAKTYVLSTHEIGATSNDRVRGWMSAQMNDLRSKVSASDNAVEKYRSEAGLLKGTTATLGTQQISELNSQITVAEAARGDAQAKVDELRRLLASRGTVEASADILSNTVVQNLREQQVGAERKVSELSATYLPGHPKMIAAQKELSSINAQVRTEAMRVAESLQGQAKVADQRAASLRGELGKQKGSQTAANASDVKLQALQRDADANRTLLQTMLNRYADANARQDASQQPGFARVIQNAFVSPAIYFPKAGPILILSTLAGLVMGFGLAFVLELLRAPVPQTPRDQRQSRRHSLAAENADTVSVPSIDVSSVEAAFKAQGKVQTVKSEKAEVAVFGAIPGAITLASLRNMAGQTQTAETGKLADAVKHLVDTVLQLRAKQVFSTYSFATVGSSSVPNGALAALATARELSSRGEKVIVLELAPVLTGIEALSKIGAGPGLNELVDGKADFTKVVTRESTSNIHIIRLGGQPTAESLLRLGAKLEQILTALRTIYAHIILHTGEATVATAPFVAMADLAVILAPLSRLGDAKAAALALDEQGGAKTLLLRLDLEGSAQPAVAASA